MDYTEYTDEFEFLKDFYHLQGKNIDWAIIEETSDDDPDQQKLKPGLMIEGSKVYVDLYERRFKSALTLPDGSSRRVLPAIKHGAGKDNEFAVVAAIDDSRKYLILPYHFIMDIHRECWYGEWMEETPIY